MLPVLKLFGQLAVWNLLPNGKRAGFYNFWAGKRFRLDAFRTRLRDDTTAAIFILDALAPLTDAQLTAAGDELVAHLAGLGSSVTTRQRMIGRSD